MEPKTLKQNLGENLRYLRADPVADLSAEAAHITDPLPCGNVVWRLFDGIMFTLLAFILHLLSAAG